MSLGQGDCSWYNSCARLDAGERSSDLDAHFRSMRVSTPREYAGQFNLPMDERANGLPTGQQTNGPTDAQRTNGPPTGAPTPSRRRAPTTDRHCYATLLSHSSFLPGTLALLHSLRAGGALLPATVLATPSALLPGATALLERFARVRLLSAAVERATAPSAKALDMMRRKPSECEGGRAHARNETGMASAQDCSQWQRLSTYVKLRLFAPNATGCGVLLYLDADCLVRGNLDPVFTAFPYALTGSVRLSSAGNPGYWTTRKTGQNMSTNWPRLAEARGWRPP